MQLFDYQKQVLAQTKELNRVAYYLDMGLGKTFVGSEKAISFGAPILIICQKSKIPDWINHFEDQYQLTPRNLTKKEELNTFIDEWLQVGVINYELAWRRPELLGLRNFTLMLDESSLIQNPRAKQSKFILKLQPNNVVLLSGTPTSGKYENLWTQAKLLGWPINEKTFLNHYVNFKRIEVQGLPIKVVDKENLYKNVERLKDKLREYGSVFMKTEDVIELPDQTFISIKCKKNKMYGQMKKHKIVDLGQEMLVGDTRLVLRLRLRQICGIWNTKKHEALKDLLESSNDRFVIFYNFSEELEIIKKIAGDRPLSVINGQTKDLSNYETEEDSITVVQYQAGSMGLNLQKANRVIYFSPPERSELFEQSKKRIHRVGQTKPCFYYQLVVENSIEELIYQALNQRKDFTDELFKEYIE